MIGRSVERTETQDGDVTRLTEANLVVNFGEAINELEDVRKNFKNPIGYWCTKAKNTFLKLAKEATGKPKIEYQNASEGGKKLYTTASLWSLAKKKISPMLCFGFSSDTLNPSNPPPSPSPSSQLALPPVPSTQPAHSPTPDKPPDIYPNPDKDLEDYLTQAKKESQPFFEYDEVTPPQSPGKKDWLDEMSEKLNIPKSKITAEQFHGYVSKHRDFFYGEPDEFQLAFEKEAAELYKNVPDSDEEEESDPYSDYSDDCERDEFGMPLTLKLDDIESDSETSKKFKLDSDSYASKLLKKTQQLGIPNEIEYDEFGLPMTIDPDDVSM